MKAAWIWQPCKSANPVKSRRGGQKPLLESDSARKNLSYPTEFFHVTCLKSFFCRKELPLGVRKRDIFERLKNSKIYNF